MIKMFLLRVKKGDRREIEGELTGVRRKLIRLWRMEVNGQ
jgi:hypothetical protein